VEVEAKGFIQRIDLQRNYDIRRRKGEEGGERGGAEGKKEEDERGGRKGFKSPIVLYSPHGFLVVLIVVFA